MNAIITTDKKNNRSAVIKIIIGLFCILMAYLLIDYNSEHKKAVEFYNQKVKPELYTFDRENRAAANRAIAKIRTAFNGYRSHSSEFVEDMSSLSSQAAMAWKGAKDFANKLAHHDRKAEAFKAYTQKKFEKHFFTQNQLGALLGDTISQYADDIRANQNHLHMRVEKAWKEAGMPGVFNWSPIMADINKKITAKSSRIGRASLESIVLASVGGGIMGFALEKIATPYLATMAIWISENMAASFAVAAGEAGGGILAMAGSGAAAGSAGGPSGAAIGMACGFIGALVADYCISRHFTKKMTSECNRFLTATEAGIIKGRHGHPGLLSAIQNTTIAISNIERNAVKKAVKKAVIYD